MRRANKLETITPKAASDRASAGHRRPGGPPGTEVWVFNEGTPFAFCCHVVGESLGVGLFRFDDPVLGGTLCCLRESSVFV